MTNSRLDPYHVRALSFTQQFEGHFWIPSIVLVEVIFLVKRRGGIPAIVEFLRLFEQASIPLINLIDDDLNRVKEIFVEYRDNYKLDFVDVVIMAMGERLEIESICTFDRRDFSVFRPKHCKYFSLLPD